MPIYEYECTACGQQLEKIQKMSDDPLVTCPACGADQLRKKISAVGFQLKGTGWYATDFKNSGKPKETSTESKSDSKSESTPKSETKTDAKPASGTSNSAAS